MKIPFFLRNKIGSHFADEKRIFMLLISVVGMIIGTVVVYNLSGYRQIPLSWKIAISSFILLLPISFYLQVSLHVVRLRDERIQEIQEKFRGLYHEYARLLQINKVKASLTDEEIKNDVMFRTDLNKRADFLQQEQMGDLHGIYLQSNHMNEQKGEDSDKIPTRRQLLKFELGSSLARIVEDKIYSEGLNFGSYLLPLSFFIFTYLAGILITLPLINSVFTGQAETTFIPIFDTNNPNSSATNKGIPLLAIQWGFLGGLVYTSISLLTRFLRKDLSPIVYFNASFKLLASGVAAVIIYFLYTLHSGGFITSNEILSALLLTCFVAGVFPIRLLIHIADTQISRFYNLRNREHIAGNNPLIELEGINSIISERLDEEGLSCIQHMAVADTEELALKTRFSSQLIQYWKEQAILFLITGDLVVYYTPKREYLVLRLRERHGIRTISQLVELWRSIQNKDEEQKAFFKKIDLLDSDEQNFAQLVNLFRYIVMQGQRSKDNEAKIIGTDKPRNINI
jgi:hypothetical protein